MCTTIYGVFPQLLSKWTLQDSNLSPKMTTRYLAVSKRFMLQDLLNNICRGLSCCLHLLQCSALHVLKSLDTPAIHSSTLEAPISETWRYWVPTVIPKLASGTSYHHILVFRPSGIVVGPFGWANCCSDYTHSNYY